MTAAVTAQDLRERLIEKLTRACSHFADDPECAEMTADAVLAALAGDPGNLPARMADAIEDAECPHEAHEFDACSACEAEAAMSVRWEDHAATTAKLDHALAELASLRDHRARWELEHEQAEKAEAEAERLRAELKREISRGIAVDAELDRQRKRADQAATELDDMEGVVTDLGVVRLELQATIERMKAVRDGWYARPMMSDHADELDAALDGGE